MIWLNVLGLASGFLASILFYFGSSPKPWSIQTWDGTSAKERAWSDKQEIRSVSAFVLLSISLLFQLLAIASSAKLHITTTSNELLANDYTVDLRLIADPGFTKFVSSILIDRCPYYEPDGVSYRSCLHRLLEEKVALYPSRSNMLSSIESQCEKMMVPNTGNASGEIVLLCKAYYLSTNDPTHP